MAHAHTHAYIRTYTDRGAHTHTKPHTHALVCGEMSGDEDEVRQHHGEMRTIRLHMTHLHRVTVMVLESNAYGVEE
jgi:hypothetical protein